MANVIKHDLVPKHSKLSNSDKEKLLKKHFTQTSGLPKIIKSDPGISNLDANEGDIIKIQRVSKTAGTAYYYRVVSEE
jgi:DNA-directed RNA polymerase subunit H